jgi:hypothetical protein
MMNITMKKMKLLVIIAKIDLNIGVDS